MEVKKHYNITKAFWFSFLAAVSFSCMVLFVKKTTLNTTTNMTLFIRFSMSMLFVLMMLAFKKINNKKVSLKTDHIYLHLFRSLFSLLSMSFLYFSLKFIPIVEANLLVLTNPLFIPILGVIFFNHAVNKWHWFAVIIGFIGVIFILKPGHALFNPRALYALGSGVCVAIGMMIIRYLNRVDEEYVSMFYYFLFSFLVSIVLVIFNWERPDFLTFLMLIGVGMFGTFYQYFLIKANVYAPARFVSALLYLSLVISLFFSWIFFKQIPNLVSWIGISFVCFCSILMIRAAKNLKAPKKVSLDKEVDF